MESLSDIETELRNLSQSSKYCELQPTVSGKPISFYFAEIADRIKAAAPTTEKSSAVGNAAAMRAVLVNIATDMILLIETPRDKKACFQPQAVLDEIKQVIPELEGA